MAETFKDNSKKGYMKGPRLRSFREGGRNNKRAETRVTRSKEEKHHRKRELAYQERR